MAKLFLTDQEKQSRSYLDWDDASLGRLCKKIALVLGEPDPKKPDWLPTTAAAVMLIDSLLQAGSSDCTITVNGLTSGDSCLGSFRVTLQKIEQEKRDGE